MNRLLLGALLFLGHCFEMQGMETKIGFEPRNLLGPRLRDIDPA